MLRGAEERLRGAATGELRSLRGRAGLPSARGAVSGHPPVRELLPVLPQAPPQTTNGGPRPPELRPGPDAVSAGPGGRHLPTRPSPALGRGVSSPRSGATETPDRIVAGRAMAP